METPQNEQRKNKVAIAGLGRSGFNIHGSNFAEMTDRFSVIAAADQMAERRQDAENEFGAKTFDDWEPMIA